MHATTLITNALIEGKIGRAGVVTTTGFGDTLLIRNEHRYDMYDLQIEFPAPPVPRDRVVEIDERTDPHGRGRQVRRRPSRLARRSPSSSARRRSKRWACASSTPTPTRPTSASWPNTCAASWACRCASRREISPQIREYPRMITTACNAATMPVIGPYLDELQKWLASEGFGGSVLMMLSNGGVVSADDAARAPDPPGRVGPGRRRAGRQLVRPRLGEDRLLCFDMGGTTAKSCLIVDGEPELTNTFEVARIYRFKKGSGFPVSVPSVDLVEIGAGGGSLARVDELGLLKVGPESAGADPGPACYGRGGTKPAVTDADLAPRSARRRLLPRRRHAARPGRVRRRRSLGGRRRSGLSVDDTAAGIHELVNQNMAAASRMHAVEQGVDLRGITVLAFGGAGPVHACGVAELLESPRVVFPVNASVLSAFGTLVTPVRIDLARSMVRPLATGRRRRARRAARRAARRGSAGAGRRRRGRRRDPLPLRRRRPLPGPGQRDHHLGRRGRRVAGDRRRRCVELFEADYRRIYGLTIPDVGVEAVTWRLSAFAAGAPVEPTAVRGHRARRSRAASGRCASVAAPPPVDTPVYRRGDLGVGPAHRRSGDRRRARDHGGHPARAGRPRSRADGSLVADRTQHRQHRSSTMTARSIPSSSKCCGRA